MPIPSSVFAVYFALAPGAAGPPGIGVVGSEVIEVEGIGNPWGMALAPDGSHYELHNDPTLDDGHPTTVIDRYGPDGTRQWRHHKVIFAPQPQGVYNLSVRNITTDGAGRLYYHQYFHGDHNKLVRVGTQHEPGPVKTIDKCHGFRQFILTGPAATPDVVFVCGEAGAHAGRLSSSFIEEWSTKKSITGTSGQSHQSVLSPSGDLLVLNEWHEHPWDNPNRGLALFKFDADGTYEWRKAFPADRDKTTEPYETIAKVLPVGDGMVAVLPVHLGHEIHVRSFDGDGHVVGRHTIDVEGRSLNGTSFVDAALLSSGEIAIVYANNTTESMKARATEVGVVILEMTSRRRRRATTKKSGPKTAAAPRDIFRVAKSVKLDASRNQYPQAMDVGPDDTIWIASGARARGGDRIRVTGVPRNGDVVTTSFSRSNRNEWPRHILARTASDVVVLGVDSDRGWGQTTADSNTVRVELSTNAGRSTGPRLRGPRLRGAR